MIMHEVIVADDEYDVVIYQDDEMGMTNSIRLCPEQVPILKDWLDYFAKKIADKVD